jgi:predicted transcriptional regulator
LAIFFVVQALRSKAIAGNSIVNSEHNLTSLTADIIAAYVTKNVVTTENLPEFIGSIHAALSKASSGNSEEPKPELKPAVSVKKSVTQDHIICLEDGKKFKSLKRHLQSHYGMSPEEYREKWGLPRDYPMVAPAYAAARSELAKTMGLGRKAASKAPAKPAKAAAKKPAAKTGRK